VNPPARKGSKLTAQRHFALVASPLHRAPEFATIRNAHDPTHLGREIISALEDIETTVIDE
jgi:hypothetical protein